MDQIVIDLTAYDVPPFATFEQMVVALSRVRTGDGVRYIGGKSVARCLLLMPCLTTDSGEDDVARITQLKVHPLIPVWRAGFAANGSLWDRVLAVSQYDPNSGGGRGNKRARGRGRASASSGDRAAAGEGVVAAAGRGSRGGARGSRGRSASGGGGDAADPAPAAAGLGRRVLHPISR
jgi:hypothetical protein